MKVIQAERHKQSFEKTKILVHLSRWEEATWLKYRNQGDDGWHEMKVES
jgi:hypothetical protein